jgi:DNA-binding MarR family transcriptional regulator
VLDNGEMRERDEVDVILEQWADARPDLNLAPLAVFSRLSRIAKQLDRIRAQAIGKSNLTSWEFDVLTVLRRSGAPYELSTKTLVKQTMVSSGTMTNRIDRMIEHRLVKRLTDPNDGRGVIVQMTPSGLTLVDVAITRISDAEQLLLADLTPSEQAKLSQLLRQLALGIEDYSK